MIRRPPRSPLFPYTTLFRSWLSRYSPELIFTQRGISGDVGVTARKPEVLEPFVGAHPDVKLLEFEFVACKHAGTLRTQTRAASTSEEHTTELQSHLNPLCRP